MSEEVRITSATGGEKGKKRAQLGSIDPQALLTLAEVAGFGGEKYERYNMLKGYDWSLSYDALQRHLLAFWSGEELDAESGLPHLGHAAWHCLTLLAFQQRGLGTDDRYVQPSEEPEVTEGQRYDALNELFPRSELRPCHRQGEMHDPHRWLGTYWCLGD